MPIFSARNRSRAADRIWTISVPSTQIEPLWGALMPQINDNNVDLPDPLSPSKSTRSPRFAKIGDGQPERIAPGPTKFDLIEA
jgi:hypothetical protein